MERLLAALCIFALWYTSAFSEEKAPAENPVISMMTSKGEIVVELKPSKAPKTVANFLEYVKSGFYEGTIFHRVIKGFMIQGGGFTPDMNKKKTNAPIQNEADNRMSNRRGTIAMARTNDPHSATAQFFINTVDNAGLDFKNKSQAGWGYCVFGRVIKGMSVVDAIEGIKTASNGMMRDVPVTPVMITKVTLVEKATAEKATQQ